MKRGMLALIFACLASCGCAGKVDTDLLQARIREQAIQLAESENEIARTRAELKRALLEAERLQAELTPKEGDTKPLTSLAARIDRVHIHSLASGGLNKDDQPGDDAVVIQFVPVDVEGDILKVPGDVEFRLSDPQAPSSQQEIGYWNFSADECREHWTRGLTSSGYQFTLPLQTRPKHNSLVLHLNFSTADDRQLEVSQIVKVVPASQTARRVGSQSQPRLVRTVDESDEMLPPVGGWDSDDEEEESDVDEFEESAETTPTSDRALQHSANWTDATIPQLR
ncbi:hypothetical protein [Schlesneria sp. DSM 10557]|uniref:hypothetical protein n=1 Tax=Schlesneria sp. DSM 10557 TaxID=3044399 RepID=UPI0035A172C3